jgi:hypothetical protein
MDATWHSKAMDKSELLNLIKEIISEDKNDRSNEACSSR